MSFENLNLGELKILHSALYLFKFGIDEDEDKRLFIVGSPLYKDLMRTIQEAYINEGNKYLPIPVTDSKINIEDYPKILQLLREFIEKSKSGVHYLESFYWNSLSPEDKREKILNFVYPFIINEELISELTS